MKADHFSPLMVVGSIWIAIMHEQSQILQTRLYSRTICLKFGENICHRNSVLIRDNGVRPVHGILVEFMLWAWTATSIVRPPGNRNKEAWHLESQECHLECQEEGWLFPFPKVISAKIWNLWDLPELPSINPLCYPSLRSVMPGSPSTPLTCPKTLVLVTSSTISMLFWMMYFPHSICFHFFSVYLLR